MLLCIGTALVAGLSHPQKPLDQWLPHPLLLQGTGRLPVLRRQTAHGPVPYVLDVSLSGTAFLLVEGHVLPVPSVRENSCTLNVSDGPLQSSDSPDVSVIAATAASSGC